MKDMPFWKDISLQKEMYFWKDISFWLYLLEGDILLEDEGHDLLEGHLPPERDVLLQGHLLPACLEATCLEAMYCALRRRASRRRTMPRMS